MIDPLRLSQPLPFSEVDLKPGLQTPASEVTRSQKSPSAEDAVLTSVVTPDAQGNISLEELQLGSVRLRLRSNDPSLEAAFLKALDELLNCNDLPEDGFELIREALHTLVRTGVIRDATLQELIRLEPRGTLRSRGGS